MRRFVFQFVIRVFLLQSLFSRILTAKSVGSKCFKAVSKAYRIEQLDDEKALSLTECSSRIFKPGEARALSLDYSCKEGAVLLSWTTGRVFRHMLGGYLLKVTTDADGPTVITKYLRVTVPPANHRQNQPESFRYRCFNTTSANKISVAIWPLSTKLEKCGAKVDRAIVTEKGNLESRCGANLCVCDSTVNIKSSVDYEQGSVFGKINIANMPAGTEIFVELRHINGTVQHKWTFVWKEGQREIYVEDENVPTGNYIFRVHRRCQEHPITVSVCQRSRAVVVRSNQITVDKVKASSTTAAQEVSNGERGYVAPLVVICASLGVLLAAILLWLITCRLGPGRQRRFINAQRIYRQLQVEKERKRAALIFAKDSKAHIRRTYRLQSELRRHGVDAEVIDEATNRGMRENWIEEGEKIPGRFDVLVFIMSPILYELCHRNETRLVEVAENGHAFHRLPDAVLHTLSVKRYCRGGRSPKVFVVSLDKTSKESNPTIKAFLREHMGICYRKPIFLKDMQKGIRKLVKEINAKHVVTV